MAHILQNRHAMNDKLNHIFPVHVHLHPWILQEITWRIWGLLGEKEIGKNLPSFARKEVLGISQLCQHNLTSIWCQCFFCLSGVLFSSSLLICLCLLDNPFRRMLNDCTGSGYLVCQDEKAGMTITSGVEFSFELEQMWVASHLRFYCTYKAIVL